MSSFLPPGRIPPFRLRRTPPFGGRNATFWGSTPQGGGGRFAAAQKVADAILYEGYALYPYRASSQKNRIRFQWGVLVPPSFATADPSERSWSQTQCLLERADALTIRLRFLSLQARDGVTFDDATENQIEFGFDLTDSAEQLIDFGGGTGLVSMKADSLPGQVGLQRLTVQVENTTDISGPTTRDEALRHSLVSCHLLAHLDGRRARFLSMMDPPEWARAHASTCENIGTYPILIGDDDRLLLSSPIILYDHPATAPESPSNLFDSTEIDEILTLRTMTLTDDEKDEARATDPRVAALIDSVDHLPPEMLDRLHGAIRSVEPDTPWWDPGADESVDPATDTVTVRGAVVGKGSRVRLRPLLRGADAQDMFLLGREAQVEAVLHDVDGNRHLAVSLVDDPAADLVAFHGRYLYFSPDEVEPLVVGS